MYTPIVVKKEQQQCGPVRERTRNPADRLWPSHFAYHHRTILPSLSSRQMGYAYASIRFKRTGKEERKLGRTMNGERKKVKTQKRKRTAAPSNQNRSEERQTPEKKTLTRRANCTAAQRHDSGSSSKQSVESVYTREHSTWYARSPTYRIAEPTQQQQQAAAARMWAWRKRKEESTTTNVRDSRKSRLL